MRYQQEQLDNWRKPRRHQKHLSKSSILLPSWSHDPHGEPWGSQARDKGEAIGFSLVPAQLVGWEKWMSLTPHPTVCPSRSSANLGQE